MSDFVEQLTKNMLTNYETQFVCTGDTNLVLEGYPRSGNTFAVDFLDYKNNEPRLKIAHHTHNFRNVLLGVELGVPTVVVVRKPIDAVCSYMIYSGETVEFSTNKYYEFHSELLNCQDSILFLKFESLVTNMNGIIDLLNARFNLNLNKSADLDYDNELVKNIDRDRAKVFRTGEDYIRTVGAPSKARDLLKGEIKQDVLSYLSSNAKVVKLYENIVSF
jgi:hypothetical protein